MKMSDKKSNKKSDNKSDKKILEKEVVNFFYKKEECRSLSNFWECDIIIVDKDGNERKYESGENCFHGEKYVRIGELCENEDRKNKLLEYGKKFIKMEDRKLSGVEGKRMGGKKGFKLNDEELELWSRISIIVQNEICKYKIENYEEVRMDLFKTKGKVLIHPAMRCSEDKLKYKIWEGKGVVVDGKVEILGRNMLGNIWMAFREELL